MNLGKALGGQTYSEARKTVMVPDCFGDYRTGMVMLEKEDVNA